MGCRIIQSLSEISGDYDALLCDLWGCYHNGLTPYPAAVEACRAFRANGGLVVLLTNAPRPAASVRRFLDHIGAPADSYDEIVSSGGACQAALESGRFGRQLAAFFQPLDGAGESSATVFGQAVGQLPPTEAHVGF